MEERLKRLVEGYYKDKTELDALKKIVDNSNAKIKELMKELDLTEIEVDGIKAKFTIQNRESLDEDKLLIQLKEYYPETSAIKTKEYVDMDTLETELYHNQLSEDAMLALDSCRTVKRVEVLKVSKGKKG